VTQLTDTKIVGAAVTAYLYDVFPFEGRCEKAAVSLHLCSVWVDVILRDLARSQCL